MGTILATTKKLFPGKAYYLLIFNVVVLFLVSILDLLGVAAILPVIQIATGEDYTTGYLGVLWQFLGKPDRNMMVLGASGILVLSFVLKGVFSLIIRWWSSGFLAKQQTANSVTILEYYATDSYSNHRRRTSAEILRATSDANALVYNAFVAGFLSAVGEGATILLLMIMLIIVMPLQAILAFAYFGLCAFALQYFLKERNKKTGETALAMGWVVSDAILNVINGFRENKILGMVPRRIYDYQQARLEAVEANRLKLFYQDLPKYLLEIIFIIGIALILAFMIFTDGIESAAYLIVFAGACVRILPSFVRMVASLGLVRNGYPAVALLDEAIDTATSREVALIEKEPDLGDFVKVNPAIQRVELNAKNLTFMYPDGGRNVLDNISFKVPAGTSLALIGGSGSGKTTIIDIILGLYQPTQGCIEFNGKNIHQNIAEWNNLVGYVPQDVYLSGKTVREEIAYGFRPDEIDETRINQCIALAELEDVIDSLTDGLDTVIGEKGTRLSGGQRQRLGIARAIYRNPSVLVLDEATSALDNETEHKITQAINKLAEEITVIIVAHRLSTVRDVDQLIYLSKGKIETQGTFEEVRAQNPEFAKLVMLGQLPE